MITTEKPMKYEVSIPVGTDYVLIRVRQNITRSLARSYTRAAVALGTEKGLDKILTDLRGFRSQSSVVDKYAFAYEDARRIAVPRSWRVAILCDMLTPDIRFLETVMQNTGHNYRVFDNPGAALNWLGQ